MVTIGKGNIEYVSVAEDQRDMHGTCCVFLVVQAEKNAIWQPYVTAPLEVVE